MKFGVKVSNLLTYRLSKMSTELLEHKMGRSEIVTKHITVVVFWRNAKIIRASIF